MEGKLGTSRALSNTNPGSLKPDSRDPETETGNLETEKRVHRIHDTLETGLHRIPRSLVAPSRGAGGLKNGLMLYVLYIYSYRYLLCDMRHRLKGRRMGLISGDVK